MKTKPVRITATAAGSSHRDIVGRIALAQTQAESARKAAKTAKAEFKQARKAYRAAKQAAKDARKQYKSLKKQLAEANAARQRKRAKPPKPKASRKPKADAAPGGSPTITLVPTAESSPMPPAATSGEVTPT